MSSQQADATGYLSGAAALLIFRTFGAEKQKPQVAISKSINGKLPLTDPLQKFRVLRRPGVQISVFSSVSGDCFANFLRPFKEGNGSADSAQSLKVSVIGSVADFGAARQVSQCFSQDPPALFFIRLVLGRAINTEIFGIV